MVGKSFLAFHFLMMKKLITQISSYNKEINSLKDEISDLNKKITEAD